MTIKKAVVIAVTLSGAPGIVRPVSGASLIGANPAVLFDQTAGTINNAWYSDDTLPDPQSMGDNFTVAGAGAWQVSEFVWYGGYENNILTDDDFRLAVWTTDTSGNPKSLIDGISGAVSRSSTGTRTPFAWDIYKYTWAIDPLILGEGTYFIEVQNHTENVTGNWAWYSVAGPNFFYHREGQWYQPGNEFGIYSLVFSVQGEAVPEPGATGMLLGLGAIILSKRRRTTPSFP